jgi:hypothetical protein
MLLFFFTSAYRNREFIYPPTIGRGTIPVFIPQKYEIMPLTMLRFNGIKNTFVLINVDIYPKKNTQTGTPSYQQYL